MRRLLLAACEWRRAAIVRRRMPPGCTKKSTHLQTALRFQEGASPRSCIPSRAADTGVKYASAAEDLIRRAEGTATTNKESEKRRKAQQPGTQSSNRPSSILHNPLGHRMGCRACASTCIAGISELQRRVASSRKRTFSLMSSASHLPCDGSCCVALSMPDEIHQTTVGYAAEK